jgi:predicted amidophosphoribosyltransferase
MRCRQNSNPVCWRRRPCSIKRLKYSELRSLDAYRPMFTSAIGSFTPTARTSLTQPFAMRYLLAPSSRPPEHHR